MPYSPLAVQKRVRTMISYVCGKLSRHSVALLYRPVYRMLRDHCVVVHNCVLDPRAHPNRVTGVGNGLRM